MKDFPIYSLIVFTFWLRYLQTRIKESCMYLSGQRFFEIPHKTPKFQEKLLLLQAKKYKQTWQSGGVFCFSAG